MIYIRSAILIICMSLYAQESFGQKRPFSDFANDTMAYLSYNFYLHQESYMGQPLSKFFNDFDLPIKCICLKTNKYNQLFNIEFCTRPASQIRANINNHDYLDECDYNGPHSELRALCVTIQNPSLKHPKLEMLLLQTGMIRISMHYGIMFPICFFIDLRQNESSI